jgi:carboxypeptidase C (cathepsin A)
MEHPTDQASNYGRRRSRPNLVLSGKEDPSLATSGTFLSGRHSSVGAAVQSEWFVSFFVLFALYVSPLQAADNEASAAAANKLTERTVVTEHDVTIAGHAIAYTATAGTLLLKDDAGQPTAEMFYVAYTQNKIADSSRRPLTFAFNGGPGSSSVWLHLGLLGPQRVKLATDGRASGPPYHVEDNPYSLLDVTDLVMIDPVSTGFSRAATAKDAKQFHGYEADIHSVGDFIRLYVTKNNRWLSPKFLIGESYGATRAAGLAGYLQDHHRMYLNGVLLVSPALNFQTISFDEGNDLPYALFLPTYTASAWYHKRLDADLQKDLEKAVAAASEFAQGPYTLALMQGDRLPAAERDQIAKQLARFCGLSVEYVQRSNLRVEAMRFTKELLRDERRTVGRFDSRFSGSDRDAVGETAEYDPSGAELFGAFTAAINDYLRRELAFDEDRPYEVLTGDVHPWDFDRFENRYVDPSESLRRAMTVNPHLRLFVASGYYDLATPLLATEYSVHHLQLAPALIEHVTQHRYEAGHMMYINESSLDKLRQDLASFYQSASASRDQ